MSESIKSFVLAVAQLAALMVTAALLCALFPIGLAAGILWKGLVSGFLSADNFGDWVTGDRMTWRIRIEHGVSKDGRG